MGMFTRFTSIDYSLDGINSKITNIGISVIVKRIKNIQTYKSFHKFLIHDYDTPESISELIYGKPDYYWTILLVNNMIDPFNEWPIDSDMLMDYIIYNYESGPSGIHHFVNMADGIICDEVDDAIFRTLDVLPDSIKAITNYEHEYDLNENRRHIIVVNPAHIKAFIRNYDSALEEKMP